MIGSKKAPMMKFSKMFLITNWARDDEDGDRGEAGAIEEDRLERLGQSI